MNNVNLLKYALYYLSLFMLAAGSLNAQSESWITPGKTWFYDLTTYVGSDDEYVKLEVGTDTTVLGLRAVNMTTSIFTSSEGDLPAFMQDFIVRQKEDQLFRFVDGDFRLLYDFSLSVGDTITIYNNFGGVSNVRIGV